MARSIFAPPRRLKPIPAALEADANAAGYRLELVPKRRVRGWPCDNERPYQLRRFKCDSFIASYATLEALEAGLKKRI